MAKEEDKISFYADYHFINATSLDEKYKDKIYPIVLIAVIIRVSKPRKPHCDECGFCKARNEVPRASC